MAKNNNYKKEYSQTVLNEIKDNKWGDFNEQSGSTVEQFIKSELENSIVDFDYVFEAEEGSTDKQMLLGKNAFGKVVCSTKIVNANPTYSGELDFTKLIIGTKEYLKNTSSNIQVNKTGTISVIAKFKYIITGNIAGSNYNETSSQSVTFAWYDYSNGSMIKNGNLPSLTTNVIPGEEISVNLSSLFEYAFSGKYLGIEYNPMNSGQNIVYFGQTENTLGTQITLKALQLEYLGEYLLRSNTITQLKLKGLDSNESASNYYYTYYLDDLNANHIKVTSTNNENLTLELPQLTEGIHDLFIRVQDTNQDESATLISNDVQISFIYQKETDSNLKDSKALVTAIPNQINNCDTSTLFKVITTDKLQGNIKVIVLKSSILGDLIEIDTIEKALKSNFIFKEIELNLNNTDPSQKLEYNSYIEVNSDSSEYLRIITSNESETNISKFYIRTNVNSATLVQYKEIDIINPKNGIDHLIATQGSILNFSQINNGNVFTDLHENLDMSDGIQLETENNRSLTIFKASPTSEVFANPKPLLNSGNTSLSRSAFSIEMLIKTYNCNNLEDEILSIGNIRLCPKHLYVFRENEIGTDPALIKNASRSDFAKNKKQHIIITFDPNYKPDTYNTIYNQLYSEGDINYDTHAIAYPCLKIYIDGVINRTISLKSEDLENNGFNLQIHPKSSNINFYTFRTYDKALSYKEIRQNFISSLLSLSEKEFFYEYNNILYNEDDFNVSELDNKRSILNTISLGKCINKFNGIKNSNYINRRVLLLALPEGIKPPYYGNRKEDEPKATFLVNYPDDKIHSGRLSGGKVKAQGSSAKKYMIHNTSYSKFKFVSEQDWDNTENPTIVDYYKMPGDNLTEIKKLVGKVNYASSMQSHKPGATKLFHEGYMNMCQANNFDTTWMNGGRKAVLEDDFLYFYVNVPAEDLSTLTWDYFREIDPATGEKTGPYNFENCYFLGFQTWGSAKGDKATSGYDDNVPYYIMLEGADNANAAANFKVPWAAMQCWKDPSSAKSEFKQFSGKDENSNPDYLTNLLINDETIVYNPGSEQANSTDKRADAWDVNFGITEGSKFNEDSDNLVFEFEEKAKISLSRFAEFYNYIYKYDFSSLVFIPNRTTIIAESSEAEDTNGNIYAKNYNKLVFGDDCQIKITTDKGSELINVKAGDIYRWEKEWGSDVSGDAPRISRWVPAGLYYSNNTWDNLNIYEICNEYTEAKGDSFFTLYDDLKAKTGGENSNYIYFGKHYVHTPYSEQWQKDLLKVMAEAFKIIVYEYTNINDVAYHQAFIRLVGGTDNRAKNTYFQIVGPINADENYEINSESLRQDFKITLYQDDLDTVFKTDNNGQQIKPYYLLEPPFNKDLENLWGDLHSGFFYNLDLVCMSEITDRMKDLLNYSVGNNWPDNETTNIYKCFLSIQKNIPAIAYNHHSEIYYESAQMLWQDGNPTKFYESLKNAKSTSWKDFSNNQVKNPLSLSHGSCYDAEVEYLRDRVLMLSSYSGSGKQNTDVYMNLSGGSQESGEKTYTFDTIYTSFIQYIYPQIAGRQISKELSHLKYDSLIDLLYLDNPDLIYNVVTPGKYCDLNISFNQSGLTTSARWESTDLYKTIWIKQGTSTLVDFIKFPNASTVICQDSDFILTKGLSDEIKVSDYLGSVENLILQEANIQALGLNFQGCNRIKTLVLGKTLNNKTDDLEITQDTKYYALKIKDDLDSSQFITINQANGCKGFSQVILPNNNTLEYLNIPNCVKTLNFGYYPNLKILECNDGTKLTNLVIDGRNDSKFINDILYNYVSAQPETIVYITNIPKEGLWLTEQTCQLLASIGHININGTINIGNGTTLTGIAFDTKKILVEKFGDIDNSNNPIVFKYKKIIATELSILRIAQIQYSGYPPLNLKVNGNDIPIINGFLAIKYELTSSAGQINPEYISINKNTGYLTIAEGHEGQYILKVTLTCSNNKNISLDSSLQVGFYTPNPGDFAYSNGTFSSIYDSSLNLVGVVYYSESLSSTKQEVRILSKDTIAGYPAGPCKLAINNNYYNQDLASKQEYYHGFLESLFGSYCENYYKDINRSNAVQTGTITYSTPSNSVLKVNVKNNSNEYELQKEYIERVNDYIEALDLDYPKLDTENLTKTDKNVYKNIYNDLNSVSSINVDGNNYTREQVGSFIYNLYPAIINTLYYESENLSGKGIDYYKIGNWYAPTSHDLSLLIHYRINSSITNNTNTHLYWNSISHKDNTSQFNIFNNNTFGQISFLKNTNNIPSIECNESGQSYYYGVPPYSNSDYTPSWTYNYQQWYSNDMGLRDQEIKIFPCCRIILTK